MLKIIPSANNAPATGSALRMSHVFIMCSRFKRYRLLGGIEKNHANFSKESGNAVMNMCIMQ